MFAAAGLVSCLEAVSLEPAGVPKMACFKARAAKTGAGVSGCSMFSVSSEEEKKCKSLT